MSINNTTFNLKELTECSVKAIFPTKINGIEFLPDETILLFTNIQNFNFQEEITTSMATQYSTLVQWRFHNGGQGNFDTGDLSLDALGLINSSNIIKKQNLLIDYNEKTFVDNGKIILKYTPISDKPITIILNQEGIELERITEYILENNTIIIDKKYDNQNVIVSYWFQYDKASILTIGDKIFNGYFKITGKFNYTDELTKERKTGIFIIPRARIAGNFNINLGRNSSPLVEYFTFTAEPYGEKGNKSSLILEFLDEKI